MPNEPILFPVHSSNSKGEIPGYHADAAFLIDIEGNVVKEGYDNGDYPMPKKFNFVKYAEKHLGVTKDDQFEEKLREHLKENPGHAEIDINFIDLWTENGLYSEVS